MNKVRILFFLISLSSCASQKVVFDKNITQPPEDCSYKSNQDFFLWGAFQTKQVSPLYICDNVQNVYSIESKKGYENVLFNIITGGIAQVHIYTPRQSLIYCKNSRL